ncbi:Alpha-L-rhamnosidase [Nostocoides australiense Ben110]|uniref:alpha-L-rhamnosidase n=1 Tax=Nostocoides australiense Ben110 TaxID=1193182 RepID=W6K0H0_9MICO|nr:family 78 glycoside hydrolase catalytic domain [Tetrasphaera australiensis]CCH74942.1 Alpha-L-rhamnosidase [Tetrasphaera australiensis Ben110]
MRIRVEHRDDALGIGERRPRLSWQLPAPDAGRQHAYRLRLDDELSPWVESDGTVLQPWPFDPLHSGEQHEIAVQVRTDMGDSEFSEPVALEAGLLNVADWQASWVSPTPREPETPGFRPAYRLRGVTTVDRPVARARLYVTAHGIHETFLNGEPVSDEVLAPGYTEYAARLHVSTIDVTTRIRLGDNAVDVLLADGWFRGSVGMPRSTDQFGNRTAYLAQLHLTFEDASTVVTGTGASWRWAPSHVVAADLIEGQQQDNRLRQSGWTATDLDAPSWEPVTVREDIGYAALTASPAPPVRRITELAAVAATRPRPGTYVLDFGQNIGGWTRLDDLTALGPAGTTLTLTHAEAVDAAGDVMTEHLRPDDIPFIQHEVRAGMVDRVTIAGELGESFEPTLTSHGFRYVRLEGVSHDLAPEEVAARARAVVVHTDLPERGSFACSNADLNALHAAAVRSFRGNAISIPTDCPTRERAGWTGDWQIYAPVASFHHDIAGFSLSWLRDLAAAQWDNGIVGNMAPMPPAERSGFLEKLNGSAGWGDAIVLVPWELYAEYGDLRSLAELWPNMQRWLAFAAASAATGRHPSRVARSPAPLDHETWLWDTGFHWGEWLVPGEEIDFPAFLAADKADVATAYLVRSAETMAAIAEVLGRPADARHCRDLADKTRTAWQQEFVGADGTITPDTQANLVRALTFGLVPDHLRKTAAAQLDRLVRDNGTRLGTGFLATRDLLPALADSGHLDTAYDLLLQRAAPGWLAMLDRGATTMWERWEGIDEDGMPHASLNHYSKGAVIGFLHTHVAGLRRTEPAWRRSRIEPRPGGGVTWAQAHHDSPHGRHTVEWSLRDNDFELTADVPAGCRADLVLPGREAEDVGPGRHTRTCRV